MRHVDHQLAAYTENLLNKKQEAAVRKHIAVCDECREVLARHEQMAHDLQLTLSQNPVPRYQQVSQWWNSIQASTTLGTVASARQSPHLAVLPTFLAVFAIFLPVAIGLVGNANAMARIHPTVVQPAVQVTVAPPTDQIFSTQEPPNAHIRTVAFTTSAAPESSPPVSTTIPLIPAPLAP